ncbi:MAG TPA: periplasmic heavy metal sensor [Hyphomicrobiaceae bacterium]|nr:periplasmic heavy metal sensor [Hyphomicrobiaceae bacterium]
MTEGNTPSAPETPASPRGRRWTRWLLIGSLALNALFIGAAASAIWRFGGRPLAVQNIPGNLVNYVDTLPPAREREVLPGGAQIRSVIAPLRRELREARRDVMAAIGTTPFDKDAYERAQMRLFEAETRLRNEQGQILSTVLSNMTAEERYSYLRWHEHRRGHQRRGYNRDFDDERREKRN